MIIDGRALWSISYGMYVVTARAGGKANGQIANAVFHATGIRIREMPIRLRKSLGNNETVGGNVQRSTLNLQLPAKRCVEC